MLSGKGFLRLGFECLINERERGLRRVANIEAVNNIIGTWESR